MKSDYRKAETEKAFFFKYPPKQTSWKQRVETASATQKGKYTENIQESNKMNIIKYCRFKVKTNATQVGLNSAQALHRKLKAHQKNDGKQNAGLHLWVGEQHVWKSAKVCQRYICLKIKYVQVKRLFWFVLKEACWHIETYSWLYNEHTNPY